MQIGDPDVQSGEFEKVDHHLVEAPYLTDHDVECLLGAFVEVRSSGIENFDRGRQSGDRRTQFVADVAGESGFAFDAGLNGIGHVVEAGDEAGQIGIDLGFQSGVETALGDVAGSFADTFEGPHDAASDGHSDETGQHAHHDDTDNQSRTDRGQGPLLVVQREGFEVLDVDVGDVHTHADVGLAVDVEPLSGGDSGQRRFDQRRWKRRLGVTNFLAEVEVFGSEVKHGETALLGPDIADQFERLATAIADLGTDQLGVVERLSVDHLVTTLQDVRPGGEITGRGERDGCQQSGGHEQQGHALAQADGSKAIAQ